jgi:hypothetical protein
VLYNENSITNIISLKHMTDKFRVTMDSKEERALLVHMPGKIVKYKAILKWPERHGSERQDEFRDEEETVSVSNYSEI